MCNLLETHQNPMCEQTLSKPDVNIEVLQNNTVLQSTEFELEHAQLGLELEHAMCPKAAVNKTDFKIELLQNTYAYSISRKRIGSETMFSNSRNTLEYCRYSWKTEIWSGCADETRH